MRQNIGMIGLGTGGQAIYELLAQGYTASTVIADSANWLCSILRWRLCMLDRL